MNKGFDRNSDQSKELKCEINQWHRGEIITFIQERPGGWSEFLISTPLGGEFMGEGAWGLGADYDFVNDNRLIVFAQGTSLLCLCDFMMALIEKYDLKAKEKELMQRSKAYVNTRDKKNYRDDEDDENMQFSNNSIIDFFVFADNLDNCYALGYDMLDHLCSQSEEGRIFKSVLFLDAQEENMHSTFDCKFIFLQIIFKGLLRSKWRV